MVLVCLDITHVQEEWLFTKGPSASENLKPLGLVVGELKMIGNQTPLIY